MIFISFSILIILFSLLVWISHELRAKPIDFEVSPNCLLTRHPLVFISCEKSPFYFGNYWNSIPHYLAEHGYIVYELILSSSKNHKQEIESFLKKHSEKSFHFIGDKGSLEVLNTLAHQYPYALNSLSCIVKPNMSIDSDSYHKFIEFSQMPLAPFSFHIKSLILRFTLLLHYLTLEFKSHLTPSIVALPYAGQPHYTYKKFLELAHNKAEKDYLDSH